MAEQVEALLIPEGMRELRKAFWGVVPEAALQDVSAGDLRQLLCPAESKGKDLKITQIFEVSMEDDLAECEPFARAFLAVLDGFSPSERRSFLLFATGVEAPPEPGTERLTVQLPFSAFSKEEHVAMLGMLPQAHTCSNTLELPGYYEALRESGQWTESQGPRALEEKLRKLLGERLRTAISETAGYELDAIDNGSAGGAGASASAGVRFAPESLVPWSPEERRTPLAASSSAGPQEEVPAAVAAADTVGPQPCRPAVDRQKAPAPGALAVDDLLECLQSFSDPEVDGALPPGNSGRDVDSLLQELEMAVA